MEGSTWCCGYALHLSLFSFRWHFLVCTSVFGKLILLFDNHFAYSLLYAMPTFSLAGILWEPTLFAHWALRYTRRSDGEDLLPPLPRCIHTEVHPTSLHRWSVFRNRFPKHAFPGSPWVSPEKSAEAVHCTVSQSRYHLITQLYCTTFIASLWGFRCLFRELKKMG